MDQKLLNKTKLFEKIEINWKKFVIYDRNFNRKNEIDKIKVDVKNTIKKLL